MSKQSRGVLKSPTRVGQTALMVVLEGPVVARALWPGLPPHTRLRWQRAIEEVDDEQLSVYVAASASPPALRIVADNPDLDESLRERARRKLASMEVDGALMPKLDKHLLRLLQMSRKKLLEHVSVADKAHPELDRVDLIAEVVALRQLFDDVRSERALARAFRALFRTRRPFVVWVIAAVCLAMMLGLGLMDQADASDVTRRLVLFPSFERPWTLATYPWVHVDGVHLVLNVLSLVLVGHVLEMILGHLRFFGVFMASAVGGGIVSIIYKQVADIPFWTAGASGAIAGLAGLALFLGLWFPRRYGRVPLRYSGAILAGGGVLLVNVVLGAATGDTVVDHGAHVGGLLIGFGLGLAIRTPLANMADATFGSAGSD